MQRGGDISPPKPSYRYLSQGPPLGKHSVLILNKKSIAIEQNTEKQTGIKKAFKKRNKIFFECLNFISYFCGETGIRTPDTLLGYTRFPGVPLQPLEHLSNRRLF